MRKLAQLTMEQSREQLEEELKRRDLKDTILNEGDNRWAQKLVERIVYGLVSLILLGVMGALIALVVNQPKQ